MTQQFDNMTQKTDERTTLDKYGALLNRLSLIPLQKITDWLDGKTDEEKTPLIVRIMFLLVVGLALASVYNIGERAYFYHANLFSYITGACFALVVPASVYVASHLASMTNNQRRYAWAVASLAALLSAFIQIKLYMVGAESVTFEMIKSGNIDVEALSFSAGIPIYEVLIASLASMVSGAHEKSIAAKKETQRVESEAEKRKAEADRIAAEKRRKEEAAEALKAKRDQDAYDLEIETKRAAAAQQLEIERLSKVSQIETESTAKTTLANARAEALRLTAESKVNRSASEREPAKKSAKKSASQSASQSAKQLAKQSAKFEDQLRMVELYRTEPRLSDEKMGERIGRPKSTVQAFLAELSAKEVVDVEILKRGKVVTVNGNFPAFEAGEL